MVMDSLSLTATATASASANTFKLRYLIPCSSPSRHFANTCFPRKPNKVIVFASRDEPNLDRWDQMELKCGRLLGEDPKLTLAKIIGKKLNPEASYLEIEKSFNKKGKAAIDEVEEIHFDVPEAKRLSDSQIGLNLTRPVPKKGVKFETGEKPLKPKKRPIEQAPKEVNNPRPIVPKIILRKPTIFSEDDLGIQNPPRLSIRPNLSLKMGKELDKERFCDMTLVRKPEPFISNKEDETSGEAREETVKSLEEDNTDTLSASSVVLNDVSLLRKPAALNFTSSIDQQESEGTGSANSGTAISMEASLQEKPQRLGQPAKGISKDGGEDMTLGNPETYGNATSREDMQATPLTKENESIDWTRAEYLMKSAGREEVEVISSSTRGFVVSFGSLNGFLPYRNLATKWKYLAFESWLRKKGLDPSTYRQNLGVVRNDEAAGKKTALESSIDPRVASNMGSEISSDMKLEDLLVTYDQEKLKYLSSFVGQKIRVSVILVDRESRRLILSVKPKETEESIEKKRSLMAKLTVGDVVKCCIKKITYFGVFVEVEGVPALIHQTEVSWDATLDPTSYFKIGQVVEAKVHQLDFSLERIFLSLKEITPDPLIDALESVVGDHAPVDGRLKAAQEDSEWADVESLVKELKQYEGIQSVSKGRFFLSPGLAPTFQVYMASMFKDQYKLLARSGNKVQEVTVQTSLGIEEMKSAILTCTNRVQ